MDAIERGERPERRVIARDAVNTDSGEVIAECGDKLTDTLIKKLRKSEINKVQTDFANSVQKVGTSSSAGSESAPAPYCGRPG